MFRMFGCKPIDTLLVVNEKLMKENGSRKVEDAATYRSLIANRLYHAATIPDIMFAACMLSRFMHFPSHT